MSQDWLGLTDSKAVAGDTGTFNLVHGTGSMLDAAPLRGAVPGAGGGTMPWFIEKRDEQFCVVKGTREEPGETEKCHPTEAEAKAHMAALYANMPEGETQKGSDKPGDYLVVEDPEKPTTWHLQVRVDGKPDHNLMGAAWAALTDPQGHRGNRYEGPDKAEALSKLRALYKSEEMPVPGEKQDDLEDEEEEEPEEKPEKAVTEPDRFFVYKAADGTPRWASISSLAVKDKEFEIVTEKAQDDAVEHARETGDFGELDLVHIPGTDVGKCDMMARAGKRLVESGTWDDSDLARRVMAAIGESPDEWGVSIKFVYDPSLFDGEKYHGNIRIRKRTILPQEMAASFGTRIVAMTGGDSSMKMSDETRAALKKLGVSEDEIEALAEKAITTEPNTVEKQEEVATEPAQEEVKKVTVWERLKGALSNLFVDDGASNEPDAGTGGVESKDEVKPDPVEVQEKAAPQPEQIQTTELAQAIAKAVSAPLIEKMGALAQELETVKTRLTEAEGVVEDKILNKLIELPPVVKVRASQVEATAEQPQQPQGAVLPQTAPEADNYVQNLIADVTAAVTTAITKTNPKAQL